MAGGAQPAMNEKAMKARHQMNLIMQDLMLSFDLMGVAHVVIWTPPPAVGGYIQHVDVIGNIFDLSGFKIPSQKVFDCTDSAIGAYERERQRLLHRSFNPLYWLGMLVSWSLRLPFRLLGAAGFDAEGVEDSLLGKLVKLALGLAAFIAAIVNIADHWAMILAFLHKCAVVLAHRLGQWAKW